MDIEAIAKKIPFTPPEGMKQWLFTLHRKEYIIYKSAYITNHITEEKEKAVECICTSCRETFFMRYAVITSCGRYGGNDKFGFYDDEGNVISSRNKYTCPLCGEEAESIHISNLNYPCRHTKHVISVHKVEEAVAVIQWQANYMVYKNGRVDFDIKPDEAYLFDKKKQYRLCTWRCGMYNSRVEQDRWVARKRCTDMINAVHSNLIFPFDSKTLDGTAMENSKLDIYLKKSEMVYPVSYLRLYQLHNNVENLVTSGMGRIISEKIYRDCPGDGYSSRYYGKVGSVRNIKGIDFKKSKPHEMVGLSKEEYRYAAKDGWSFDDIYYYKRLKPFGADYKDITWYKDVISTSAAYEFTEFEHFTNNDGHTVPFEKLNVGKTAYYIMKQSNRYDDECDWHMLRDYWRMLAQLGMNVNDMSIRYPQRLKRAHDQVASRLTYKKNKDKEAAFLKRYNELVRFMYFDDALEIHPARSPEEMANEGKALHHCVASYIDSHASGKTSIFFIRRRTRPEKSYFTLEFDFNKMTVRQNRGMNNCARTSEVQEFENKWLEFVEQVIKNEKEKENRNNERVRITA